jgi:hypothetical protein
MNSVLLTKPETQPWKADSVRNLQYRHPKVAFSFCSSDCTTGRCHDAVKLLNLSRLRPKVSAVKEKTATRQIETKCSSDRLMSLNLTKLCLIRFWNVILKWERSGSCAVWWNNNVSKIAWADWEGNYAVGTPPKRKCVKVPTNGPHSWRGIPPAAVLGGPFLRTIGRNGFVTWIYSQQRSIVYRAT